MTCAASEQDRSEVPMVTIASLADFIRELRRCCRLVAFEVENLSADASEPEIHAALARAYARFRAPAGPGEERPPTDAEIASWELASRRLAALPPTPSRKVRSHA